MVCFHTPALSEVNITLHLASPYGSARCKVREVAGRSKLVRDQSNSHTSPREFFDRRIPLSVVLTQCRFVLRHSSIAATATPVIASLYLFSLPKQFMDITPDIDNALANPLANALADALTAARALRNEPKRLIGFCDMLRRSWQLGPIQSAEVHLMQGVAHRAMGQLAQAEHELGLAAQLASSLGNHRFIAMSYLQLGAIKVESHDFESARRYLTLARNEFILCCSLEGEAHVLFNFSNLLLIEKRYADARLALEDALLNYNEVGNLEGMSQVIATSALIHMLEGHYELSIEKLQECERLFLDVGNKKNALANAINRAECYIHLENHSYAHVLLCSTRERAKALGYHVLEARALLVLSNLSQRQSEAAEASKHFYDARELAITNGFEPLFEALVRDMQLA